MHESAPPVSTDERDPKHDTRLSVELWSLARSASGGFDSTSPEQRLAARFDGPVALATTSHQLIVVGRDDDHQIGVYAGTPAHLQRVGAITAHLDDVAALVEVVLHRDQWHLFGYAADGHTTHHVSTDLAVWQPHAELHRTFPAFSVTGVAIVGDRMVLAGRVVVDHSTYGWGMLASDGTTFEARQVPVPLSAQLKVVGPIANDGGDITMLLDSGTNHTVARSTGLGWTLSLLSPLMVPCTVFHCDGDIWMAGRAPDTGEPAIARVGGRQLDTLGGHSGPIRNAVVHGAQLIVARESL
jgi:hypothetical protein